MSYLYTDITTELNDQVHNKLGSISDVRALINRAVRSVRSEIDLKAAKRTNTVPQGFFNSIEEIPAPSDLAETAIIDLAKQISRSADENWVKTTPEEFNRRKGEEDYLFAVDLSNDMKKIKVNNQGSSVSKTINECDSLTGNGSWSVTGDAENLIADSINYLTGVASLRFDTKTGATTANILNSTMDAVDLSDEENNSTIFYSLYIPNATAAAALTSLTMKIGSDASNYFSKALTTAFSGSAFKAGWNLLAVDWATSTETGTVDTDNIVYADLLITKSAALAATKGWRLDKIACITGDPYNVSYYSDMLWQSSAGTYIEKSTADTDFIEADEDEKDLIIAKAGQYASQVLREKLDLEFFSGVYSNAKKTYQQRHKSERKPLINTNYEITGIN